MINKLVLCSKCSKELKNPTYFVPQLGYLCGECAREHAKTEINKLEEQVMYIENQIMRLRKKVNEAIENDCEHEYVDTGYGIHEEGRWLMFNRCLKCNKQEFKELKF